MKNFKKIAAVTLALLLCSGLAGWAQAKEGEYVDTYSSASEASAKSMLQGDAFEAAAKALQTASSDLASLAKTKTAGYVAPKSLTGNVMSTNPDGSVGISTITQWAYAVKSGPDTLTLQLTQGQNALNLAEVGHRGTLFVPGVAVSGKNYRYFVHFKVVNIDLMKYSDDAFKAGKFNSYYSGKDGKKSQYTLTCEVLALEEVSGSVKLSVVMP
jgi:hypothetical protein